MINKPDTLNEAIENLTEQEAKFIIHASVVSGHLPRYWFDKGIELARLVKNDK